VASQTLNKARQALDFDGKATYCKNHDGGELGYLVSLLGILNANRKIRKRTDTDVAFTQEYSRVSIFHRERECTN